MREREIERVRENICLVSFDKHHCYLLVFSSLDNKWSEFSIGWPGPRSVHDWGRRGQRWDEEWWLLDNQCHSQGHSGGWQEEAETGSGHKEVNLRRISTLLGEITSDFTYNIILSENISVTIDLVIILKFINIWWWVRWFYTHHSEKITGFCLS